MPVSEVCRSFAFNASLQDGISSADLGPTIIWDCVLVLVSIFVATLPAIAKMIERGSGYIRRHLAPNLSSIFIATLLEITKMIEWIFKYSRPYQAPDLEMQVLAGRGAPRQSDVTVGSIPPDGTGCSSLSQPSMPQHPDPTYQRGGDDLSAGGMLLHKPEEQPLYHAI